jgi:hypothetical protein
MLQEETKTTKEKHIAGHDDVIRSFFEAVRHLMGTTTATLETRNRLSLQRRRHPVPHPETIANPVTTGPVMPQRPRLEDPVQCITS